MSNEEKEQRIRERAYQIWLDEGQPEGRDKDHWERAQAEMNAQSGESESGDGEAPQGEPPPLPGPYENIS